MGEATSSQSLATLAGGNLVAVWQSAGASEGQAAAGVYAQLYDDAGVAQGAVLRISTQPPAGAGPNVPVVTGLADGRFVVAYTVIEADPFLALMFPGSAAVGYRIAAPDGSVSEEWRVEPEPQGMAQAAPVIATLDNGQFTIRWIAGGAVFTQTFHGTDRPQAAGVPTAPATTLDYRGAPVDPDLPAFDRSDRAAQHDAAPFAGSHGERTLGGLASASSTHAAYEMDVAGERYDSDDILIDLADFSVTFDSPEPRSGAAFIDFDDIGSGWPVRYCRAPARVTPARRRVCQRLRK